MAKASAEKSGKQQIEVNIGWPTFHRLIIALIVSGALALTVFFAIMTLIAPLLMRAGD
ncbi:hypothetical protein HZC09_02800 [Candidatus Micrarchaeota archaeon]|nr:hypothetical protein [Candidatus Micrarchaeota archaeon]